MTPAIYATIALCCYTAFNAAFSRGLSHITPAVAIPIYTSVVVVGGIVILIATKTSSTVLPSTSELGLLVACGVLLTLADLAFISAYNKGGSLALVATIVSLLPVTTAALNLFVSGKLPSGTQALAFLLAIGSVALVMRAE